MEKDEITFYFQDLNEAARARLEHFTALLLLSKGEIQGREDNPDDDYYETGVEFVKRVSRDVDDYLNQRNFGMVVKI